MTNLPANTCLYFGTFNPIHTGHLMVAQAVLQQFWASKKITSVTFIPAGDPPHRHQENDLLDARRRLKMVELATAANPAFLVSDIELQRTERSYTIATLRQLIEKGQICPPVPMIIGADALAGLASWREPLALIESVHFLQAPRPGYPDITSIEIEGQPVALSTSRIDMPTLSLSSSRIRNVLAQNPHSTHLLRYFLPEPVRQYIAANHLYQK
jgi:nicotinate-nucleotide adenylyltransferase